jgi:hypothetical protein
MARPKFDIYTNGDVGAEFLANVTRLAAENHTPMTIRLKPGTLNLSVIIGTGASLLSILKTVWGIRKWLRNRRAHPQREGPLEPRKNRAWARAQAKAWVVFEAGADPNGLVAEMDVSTDEGWKFRFRDENGRVFFCLLTRSCNDYFQEVKPGERPKGQHSERSAS